MFKLLNPHLARVRLHFEFHRNLYFLFIINFPSKFIIVTSQCTKISKSNRDVYINIII